MSTMEPYQVFLVAGIVALIILLLACLPRSKVPRLTDAPEGIDDEAVADAFGKMQEFKPFVMIRNAVIKRLLKSSRGRILTPGEKILDLGCGTGNFLMQLGRKLNQQGIQIDLYGIDISDQILKICEEKLEKAGVAVEALENTSGASMPFPRDHFSTVTTSISLHHWSKPAEVLDEIYRVLAPGGRLILLDFRRDARRFYHYFLRFITRVVVPKALKDAREPLTSYLSSYTRAEVQEMLRESSWNGIEVDFTGWGMFMILELVKEER